MEIKLIELMGGRVAEKLVLEDISTGAQNDLERATKIARNMVTQYGMTDSLGPMTYGSDDDDDVFMGRDLGKTRNYSEDIAAAIDRETRSIIDKAYAAVEELLSENLEKLHIVAQELLEKETLNAKEFEELFEIA